MIDRAALRAATRYENGRLYWVSHPRWPAYNGRQLGGTGERNGYPVAMFNKKRYSLHWLVWAWHHDTDPPMINHIDEDQSNNRIENLEASDPSHNIRYSAKKRDLPHCIEQVGPNSFRAVRTFKSKRYRTQCVPTVEQAQQLLNQLEESFVYTC